MGRGSWRDAKDRRPHVAVLVVLLGMLTALVGLAPVAIGGYSTTRDYPIWILQPSITGDTRIGGTVTCTPGTWDDGPQAPYRYEYGWSRHKAFEHENMPDEDAQTYKVKPGDAGWSLRCDETAHHRHQHSSFFSNEVPVSSPVVRAAPALSGDDRLGGELTCSRGTWDDRGLPAPYAVTYAWRRDGEPIGDSRTHTVGPDDVGRELTCVVTAEGATAATTGSAHPLGPINGTPPHVGGDLRVGGTATCSGGTWDGSVRARVPVAARRRAGRHRRHVPGRPARRRS